MDQAANEFLVEIEDLVEQIYLDLDALGDGGLDGPARRAIIDRVFRRVHSVKGSGATCGLQVVSQIAHEFESLLDAARAGRIVFDEAILATCESATDALSESLRLAAAGIVEPSRRDLFARLQAVSRIKPGNSNVNDEEVLKRIASNILQPLTDAERYRLISALKEGNSLFTISASFEVSDFDKEFVRLQETLANRGEIISTSPTVNDSHPNRINFLLLYTSSFKGSELETDLQDFPHILLKRIDDAGALITLNSGEYLASTNPTPSSVSSLANFVRTDLDTLDRLISSTHELFRRTCNALDQAEVVIGNSAEDLFEKHEQLKASFLGLEDQLINLRMVSLAPTLQRVVRSGKTAARQAQKEINFEVAGGDLRIDKLLADAIADPLIHLIRNAVDHGIENRDARLEAGKSKCGTVRIEAMSEGGRTRVRVTDDGRGVDPDLISAAATRLGLFDSGTELDIDRSLRLIFRPGFTTADSVSDLSGRGVGLDVVETTVEQAGGELRVSSAPGTGTTFEIRLPVTFGLIEATVVVSEGHRYCLAANQVGLNQENSKIEVADEKTINRVSLRELLGQSPAASQNLNPPLGGAETPRTGSAKNTQIFVYRFADNRHEATGNQTKSVEVIVDDIEGTEKVLVRSLGRHAGRWYGVAGATELRDGTVALVLDLSRLLAKEGFTV